MPTIRPESWKLFIEAWESLFAKHAVTLIKVDDSTEYPTVYIDGIKKKCDGRKTSMAF